MLFLAAYLMLCLLTFDIGDPSLNHVVSSKVPVSNKGGLFGAYIAGFLNDVFGIAAYIWPALCMALGAVYISSVYELLWWRWCGYFVLTLCLLSAGAAWNWHIYDVRGGGMVGHMLHEVTTRYFNPSGASLIWIFALLVGLQLAFGISWLGLVQKGWERLVPWLQKRGHLPPDWKKRLPKWKIPNILPALPRKKDTVQTMPEIMVEPLPSAGESLGDETAVLPAVEAKVSEDDDDAQRAVEDEALQLIMQAPPSADADADGQGEAVQYDAPYHEVQEEQPVDTVIYDEPYTDDTAYDHAEEFDAYAGNDADIHSLPAEEYEAPVTTTSAEPVAAAPIPVVAPAVPLDVEAKAAKPAASSASTRSCFSLADHAAPAASGGRRRPLPLPSLDLLTREPANANANQENMQGKGQDLISCLKSFDIRSELVRVTPGPVVTMFEVRPAAGIRVNRIANLADDLALALKAMAVRIQAPIPGSDTVGIEIPNVQRHMVNFRSLLESQDFRKSEGLLQMAIGKDIAGRPFTADLARMPHLLVAGATGAGKSVCLNSILLSFLYRARPDEVKLLLVDPKRIEMATYADLPHLVHPVVTEMTHAKTALDWAVHEMEQRFVMLGKLQVRNLAAYNEKLKSFGNAVPEEYAGLEPLPYLVIVIDELADLMLTAAREVETSIVRLAQLARAAGIHMILATQRPSVDVVTGIIKANFPCRISFQVTSKHDSRTILDAVGAEYLLGKGDMLFKHSGGRLQRLHGPFVSDEEVQAVVGYWKRMAPPSYNVDFSQWGNEGAGETMPGGAGDAASDPLYGDVQAFVLEQGKASISFIQRRFKIGFNRAARIVEQLERDGIIIPGEGGKTRVVAK